MAAASLVPPEESAAETECPVCRKDLTEPKILPCGHVLCSSCLLSKLQSDTDPHCPLCQCAIVEPDDTRSSQEVVDCLPCDLTMEALVASMRTLRQKHVCCVCDDVAASTICLECGDTFCPACTKVHQKQSVSRHHTVEDLATMTAEKLTSSRRPPCMNHTAKPSSVFCPAHGASVCFRCATLEHHTCSEVKELKDILQEARTVLGELAATLQAEEEALEKGLQELDRHMADTEKQADKCLAHVDAALDRLQKSLDACRSRLKELVLKAKDDVRNAVNGAKSILQARRGKLTSHKSLVERGRQTAPPGCIDKVKVSLEARVKELDCEATLPADCPTISTLALAVNEQQLSRLERELGQLGEVILKPATLSLQKGADKHTSGFCFHDNCGQNIQLRNNGRTAERVNGMTHAIVVSGQEMLADKLYEVRLDERDDGANYMWLGVTVKHPQELVLPQDPWRWKDAIVIIHDSAHVLGSADKSVTVGKLLLDLPVGTRVGLAVDAARCLHLYLDGVAKGVVAKDVAQTCYAFFSVEYIYRKITALPVTNITSTAAGNALVPFCRPWPFHD